MHFSDEKFVVIETGGEESVSLVSLIVFGSNGPVHTLQDASGWSVCFQGGQGSPWTRSVVGVPGGSPRTGSQYFRVPPGYPFYMLWSLLVYANSVHLAFSARVNLFSSHLKFHSLFILWQKYKARGFGAFSIYKTGFY